VYESPVLKPSPPFDIIVSPTFLWSLGVLGFASPKEKGLHFPLLSSAVVLKGGCREAPVPLRSPTSGSCSRGFTFVEFGQLRVFPIASSYLARFVHSPGMVILFAMTLDFVFIFTFMICFFPPNPITLSRQLSKGVE